MSPSNQIYKSYCAENNESTIKQRFLSLSLLEIVVIKLLVTVIMNVIITWYK